VNALVVDVDYRRQRFGVGLGEDSLRGLSPKWGKPNGAAAVTREREIDEAVAQTAYAVKEKDGPVIKC
jgi:hypothetical protein